MQTPQGRQSLRGQAKFPHEYFTRLTEDMAVRVTTYQNAMNVRFVPRSHCYYRHLSADRKLLFNPLPLLATIPNALLPPTLLILQ